MLKIFIKDIFLQNHKQKDIKYHKKVISITQKQTEN